MEELLSLLPSGLIATLLIISLAWQAGQAARSHRAGSYQPHSEWLHAKERAEKLLLDVLGAEEHTRLSRLGYLEVASPNVPGRTYRIPKYRGRVRVYEDGHAVMSLCVQPVELIPDADVVLIHKLMIEGNEQEYLRLANRFDVTPFRPYV